MVLREGGVGLFSTAGASVLSGSWFVVGEKNMLALGDEESVGLANKPWPARADSGVGVNIGCGVGFGVGEVGKLEETGRFGDVERSATDVGNVGAGWRKKWAGVWKSVTVPWVGEGLRGVGDGAAVEVGVPGRGVNTGMGVFGVGVEADEDPPSWV